MCYVVSLGSGSNVPEHVAGVRVLCRRLCPSVPHCPASAYAIPGKCRFAATDCGSAAVDRGFAALWWLTAALRNPSASRMHCTDTRMHAFSTGGSSVMHVFSTGGSPVMHVFSTSSSYPRTGSGCSGHGRRIASHRYAGEGVCQSIIPGTIHTEVSN